MSSSSSLRIKVQYGEKVVKNYHSQESLSPVLKFVFVIESPSHKTIDELIRMLQKYLNQEFLNQNIQIVQLITDDGYLLSKSDLCSNVLKDNDQITCINMQKFSQEFYPTIDFDTLWLELKQHDASDNQEKTIQIGLNTFLKFFIRIYAKPNMYGIYAFSLFDLIRIASEKRRENLIARFVSNDDSNQTSAAADWFIETKWEYDTVSNQNLFVICNLKVGSSDQVISNKLQIVLDPSRMRIQKGEITRLSGEINDSNTLTDQQRQRLKELIANLPPPKRTGPQFKANTNENLKVTKHECEGESSIRMTYGNTNTVNTWQDLGSRDEGSIFQFVTITHIIFSKKPQVLPEILQQKRAAPVDKPVSVASLTVFYQAHDESWRECRDAAIAPISIRNEQPRWLTDTVINIEPDKLHSYSIRCSILTKGELGGNNAARERVHKTLPQPLKLKIVVTDNFSRQSSLIVEQLNKPLYLPTRETFLKNNQSSVNEFLGFVYADDCEAEERYYMTVYINKENILVVGQSQGYSTHLQRNVLRTMEYNAKQAKTSETDLDQIHYNYDKKEMKAIALFDPETYIFYGVRLEITTKTSKSEEIVPIPIEKLE